MTEATLSELAPSRTAPARWADYIMLLKPRVMSLVVFTGLTGLVASDTPMNPFVAATAVLCITVGAGASGALNMAYDSDIDAVMRRTRKRPVAAGRIARGDAMTFGVILAAFSVMVMALAVNYLSAGLLAFTIVFYALVYTVWLKRSTPQNIVIGGLAGALPPVIGWAAASGHAPLNAWLMVAIIFIWTPPHFWALALNTGEDYAKAGVPMMPVVKGARSTRNQILAYSIALVLLGVAPWFTHLGHLIYAVVSLVGGAIFMIYAVRLWLSKAGEAPTQGPDGLYSVKPGAREARDLFAYSILYLTLLFAALLIEHGTGLSRLLP